MKIAQVCPRYYPYIGGVETVVKEISEGLVRTGTEVEVLSQDPLGKYPMTEILNGVTVRRFRTGPLGWDFGFSNGSLRNFLKGNSNEYAVIHAHSYHAFPSLYAAWAKDKNKLVFNAYYHGRGHNFLMSLLHIPYRSLGKTTFEKADKIICVSETEKQTVQRYFPVPDEKVVIIPDGVYVGKIARATPFPCKGKLLLYVGRLEKYKKVHLAIKAMPYLPTEYKLKIIGSGPYKQKLLQLIQKLHLSDRVQILSGLSNDEVYRWYKTCNVVLNLSDQESFGLTVIESLAAGKPVIVNNQTALKEMAAKLKGVYGIDAERLSSEQLAEQIVERCRSEVITPDLSEYSWDSITQRIKNLYEGLW